ncbi:hypothetical protein G6L37_35105 [Agrobacterium rubi]|nr:hypothetical protein [Agrobacterium rubi]NTF23799.1 hypothetical protein [Agrobacterium rubi]
MLVLLPHRNRYEIDGVRHDFEGPMFLPKLTSSEGGLFMAVRDDRHPTERVFLHMPLAYAMQIMGGWFRQGDATEASKLLIPFALQNISVFQNFVLNVTVAHLASELGTTSTYGGHQIRLLRLRKPENITPLEDYSN